MGLHHRLRDGEPSGRVGARHIRPVETISPRGTSPPRPPRSKLIRPPRSFSLLTPYPHLTIEHKCEENGAKGDLAIHFLGHFSAKNAKPYLTFFRFIHYQTALLTRGHEPPADHEEVLFMKKVVIAVAAAGLLSAAGTALAKPGKGQKTPINNKVIRTAALFSASIRVSFAGANRRAVSMPSGGGIAAGKRMV